MREELPGKTAARGRSRRRRVQDLVRRRHLPPSSCNDDRPFSSLVGTSVSVARQLEASAFARLAVSAAAARARNRRPPSAAGGRRLRVGGIAAAALASRQAFFTKRLQVNTAGWLEPIGSQKAALHPSAAAREGLAAAIRQPVAAPHGPAGTVRCSARPTAHMQAWTHDAGPDGAILLLPTYLRRFRQLWLRPKSGGRGRLVGQERAEAQVPSGCETPSSPGREGGDAA